MTIPHPVSWDIEPRAVSRTNDDQPETDILVIVEKRRLERECFVRSIELLHPRVVVLGYETVDDFIEAASVSPSPSAIIYNVGARDLTEPLLADDLKKVVEADRSVPVVVLAASEVLEQIVAALEAGARGYISVNIGIDAIVEATKLASSGGVFLTTGSLSSWRHSTTLRLPAPPDVDLQLTSRQASVADALRRGKANKVIAYELNMCESTVKVHIRNIMRKLNASNRTEAAFKLNAVRPEVSDPA